MAAARPSLGRVLPESSILFLCDMQEKFRHIAYFPQIVSVAARMLKVARLLEVPAVLTEQYPEGLGPTVPELGAEGLRPVAKTCFSMVPAVQRELDTRPQLRSVLLCGIETQACILNTTLDLLDRGLQVHVVVDACSSRRSRRSLRSLPQTVGCWDSSKARIPSSAELTLKTTLLSLGPQWNHFAPVLGSQEWCSPPGEPPPREGRWSATLPLGQSARKCK
ncbi:isochorismatase domain-containing protein 2 isoform X1 [Ursus americanus]|uniref:Isochorismatase domain containing 2 n=2 Tax=Ursus TaxID=9639 RepID=A0A384DML0_URSMA|nr:isochorismatase domain-containing protein 2 isoform X1 [Ursus maritimus]XP_045645241.1 isochorismatase domain-containing protein 2 isoform X1 [Ursus americanus]XP_057170049.1 isochorismatase domain-containing protein 2 isoform X1 [Ursus arctos]